MGVDRRIAGWGISRRVKGMETEENKIMYEDKCYRKTFLKEVIFRIDFLSPLEAIEKSVPKSISKTILKRFPILEPRKAHTQEFQLTGPNLHARSSEMTQWVFYGKEREKSIVIDQNAIVFLVKEYKSYENLLEDIDGILKIFFSDFKEIAVARVGLRYVNVIEIDEPEPLVWKRYINEDILGIIDFHDEKQFLTRVFHIVEFNFDGLAVKYQFGLANPDYPALIKRKNFVLDIDAYSNGSFDYGDVMTCLEDAHKRIQDIFERSITDNLRQLMRPGYND